MPVGDHARVTGYGPKLSRQCCQGFTILLSIVTRLDQTGRIRGG